MNRSWARSLFRLSGAHTMHDISYRAEVFPSIGPRNAYLHWLLLRRPFPVRLGPTYSGLVWFVTLLAVLAYLFTAGHSVLTYAPLYAFLLFTFLDFLVFLPIAFHKSRADGMDVLLLAAPLSTRDVVSSLRLWAYKMNFPHVLPTVALLVTAALVIALTTSTRHAASGRVTLVGDVLALLPLVYVTHRFFLATGLVLASLPRWVTYSGLTLVAWVVPVLWGAYWLSLTVAPPLFEYWQVTSVLTSFDPRPFPSPPAATYILMSLLLLIPVCLEEWSVPRLMEISRRGAWS